MKENIVRRILCICFAVGMVSVHENAVGTVGAAVAKSGGARTGSGKAPTIAQFLSPAYPFELVSAKKRDRVAWLAYEQGRRNVYAAAAPDFRPVRLTRFLDDNGTEISSLNISDDGEVVMFVRGTAPNREGWIANPTGDPDGAARTIWAARTDGSAAWKLGEGTSPTLSPDGRFVLFAEDGQIYRLRVARLPAVSAVDKAEKPLINAWGANSNPRWSPDGTRVAFVSNRVDHGFIGVYAPGTRAVTFMSPSVDHDTSPAWSPDGKRVAFIRRPGTPFAQQAHEGSGGIGNPPGPAYIPGRGQTTAGQRARGAASAVRGGPRGQGGPRGEGGQPSGRGRGQGGRGGPGTSSGEADQPQIPGLTTAAFKGGYTLSFWVADAATGEAHEFWHNTPGDRGFDTVTSIQWAGNDRVVFSAEPEEWIRYYSVSVAEPAAPVMLTPGDGMVENVGLSSDGKSLFYTTNAGDIDRRHVWRVPTAGGEPTQLTKGETIETYPAALASGNTVAVLSADARRPQSVGLVPARGGEARIIFPILSKDFPIGDEVVPQAVITKAEDGLEIHNQLFLPKDLAPGERRPAMVFVHGGPIRQMLLGYHYMHFYHIAYAVNQWLASQGYVVMSVNYRSGIGYGKSFRLAPNTGGRGNAEYQDVVAGARYLQSRSEVDPKRVGIWGLSYGGLLTSQALARNSDIFVAGVDLAGVHLYGSSLDPESVSYQSSAISAIDKWKSPVLLVHGDDDRNVAFSQTTGLVQLLRAHDVYYELIVNPDDTHETLLHKRWLDTFGRMEDFLKRFVRRESERPISEVR
jgi:dipeptidyl-peptidase-4